MLSRNGFEKKVELPSALKEIISKIAKLYYPVGDVVFN